MSAAIEQFRKRADAVLDYEVDWSRWIPETDSIASVVWTTTGSVTQPRSSSHTTNTATIWLAGGSDGEDCLVTCEIATVEGRTDARAFLLRIRG